ncbi:methyltransferase domain-containing protein [Luteimonas sp. R10]|uniref:methyltransferase domain-containing protein n=1 Tax=Luteimonas sp. R10 TaxID=3108176 RepID=UPI00308FB2E8|nr:methyltransferase domain-containing protein [Luteimonas sp. R10]
MRFGTGKRLLDDGCPVVANAGFYSFELVRRGARVTAIDVDDHYLRQARWAAGRFGLADRIEFRRMSVYELAHQRQAYDLVWLMGVFYHLRHPCWRSTSCGISPDASWCCRR